MAELRFRYTLMDECRSNVLANFKLCEQVAVLAFLDLSQRMSQRYAELYYFVFYHFQFLLLLFLL